MQIPKAPYVASPDQIRMTRDGDTAIFEYADDAVAVTHLKDGADMLAPMSDEELLGHRLQGRKRQRVLRRLLDKGQGHRWYRQRAGHRRSGRAGGHHALLVVDKCVLCATDVKYKGVKLLA
jgi:hypothetical protein